jgi:hypothetical protein
MGREFDEALLVELIIERTLPLIEKARQMKAAKQKRHNLGQWERLLRDLTQTDPKITFQGLSDDKIFKMITGLKDFERRTVIGGSGKPKLNQAVLDRPRTIKGFAGHHIFGLDENQMITLAMTKPADLAGVSAVRRANDRVAFFQTQTALGRKSGTEQIVSEATATHTGMAVPGSSTTRPSLSQAASYHEGATKVTKPFMYEVGMDNPEAMAMEFHQNNERLAQRSAVLQEPSTPTHSNRLRNLRLQTIQRSNNPKATSQMWVNGEFDKLDKLYPDLGIAQTYQEAMMPGAMKNDRLLKPGEVVDPVEANIELEGGRVGLQRARALITGQTNPFRNPTVEQQAINRGVTPPSQIPPMSPGLQNAARFLGRGRGRLGARGAGAGLGTVESRANPQIQEGSVFELNDPLDNIVESTSATKDNPYTITGRGI